MRTAQRIALAVIVGLLVLGVPAVALAATPHSSAVVVSQQGFEGTLPGWTIGPINGLLPPVTASWGVVTQSAHTGTKGLWCAGSNAAAWPLYPNWTYGAATLDLPQLKDYYSSSLSLWYTMPTVGAEDANAFNVSWATPGSSPDSNYGFPLTAANAWSQLTFSMSSVGNNSDLSRRAGDVRLQFIDRSESQAESPTNGQGVTVDDLSVTGYMYGPIRSLAAPRSGSSVKLTWLAPYGSPGRSTVDTRTISYHVFRSLDSNPAAWTDLGTTTTHAYTDASAPAVACHYFVQAFNATATSWGDPSGSSKAVAALPGAAPTVTRISGAAGTGRVQTAIAASQHAYPLGLSGSKTVVIANGWDWQDSLIGEGLAGKVGGPLLLVSSTTAVPTDVGAEIRRLGATKAYVIGPTTQVTAALATNLGSYGVATVVRKDGGSAGGTSRDVATEIKALRGGTTGGTVFLARDDDFADALSASSLAAKLGAPILLTNRTTLSTTVDTAIKTLKPATIVICGGSSGTGYAVSAAIETALKSTVTYNWTHSVLREAGLTRYDTAIQLVKYGQQTLNASPKHVYVAAGRNFPDALGGGVLAAVDGGVWNPLILTEATYLVSQDVTYVSGVASLHDGFIMGSGAAIAQPTVDNALKSLLHP